MFECLEFTVDGNGLSWLKRVVCISKGGFVFDGRAEMTTSILVESFLSPCMACMAEHCYSLWLMGVWFIVVFISPNKTHHIPLSGLANGVT